MRARVAPWFCYVLSVVAVAAAAAINVALAPYFGPAFPWAIFHFAVFSAACVGGLRPALLALALGFLLTTYFFVTPGTLALGDRHDLAALGVYLFIGLSVALLINSLHRSRHRFKQAAAQARATLSSIGDAVIVTDVEGRVISLNSIAERLTGWSMEEAQGRLFNEVFRIVNEDTRLPADNPVKRVLRDGTLVDLANHALLISRHGEELPIDDTAAPIRDDQGQLLGVVLVFRDITQRRRAERRLLESEQRNRSMFETVADGIITIDDRGTIQTVNPAVEGIFGHCAAELIGRNVTVLMPEPYHSEHDRYLEDYLSTGKARIIGVGREVQGKRKDGSLFPLDLAVSQFWLGDRRYFTGIVRDVTERKQAEEAICATNRQLAAADERKDEFLAMLAHELRNPLATIQYANYLSRFTNIPAEEFDPVQTIETQVAHLSRLIDDLLDISRITRGKTVLRKENVDVVTVVKRAAAALRPFVHERKHELVMRLPDTPLFVQGDTSRLEQIVQNLINNAAKYTEEGGRIEVSVRAEDSEVFVAVKDNGAGMPPDLVPRVFDLFTQGERTLDRSLGGLGIGLTLVRQLTEMHGGSVTAESEGLGQGSTFTIRLPRVTDLEGAAIAEPAPVIRDAHPVRVLIVEDQVESARAISLLLRASGHDVQTCHHGCDALHRAQAHRPDVILLDIGLPGKSGYEIARELRADQDLQHIAIIAVSGYGQERDRVRSCQAGFDHHLVKPIDVDVLQSLLATVAKSLVEPRAPAP